MRFALAPRQLASLTLGLALLAGVPACDSGSSGDGDGESSDSESDTGDPQPTPTGAQCDPANTLTYENFGEAFMDDYCTACHASTVTGDDRFDAPVGVDYDTQADIQMLADDIDAWAAATDEVTNAFMPPPEATGAAFPSLQERRDLAAWLACGAP